MLPGRETEGSSNLQGFSLGALMQLKATTERTKTNVCWIKLSRCLVGMVTRGNETHKNETMGRPVSQLSRNPTLDLQKRRSIVNVSSYLRGRFVFSILLLTIL